MTGFRASAGRKGHLDVDEWLAQEFMFQIPRCCFAVPTARGYAPVRQEEADCTCPPEEDKAAPVDARLAILKSLLN